MSAEQLRLIATPPTAADAHDCWRTPPGLFALLDREFHFVVDLAASQGNALCPRYLDDALTCDWPRGDVGWCWLNPPFSALPEFFAKLWCEVQMGSRVVALVPGHRHEQEWFHRYVIGTANEMRFPRGRVNYVPAPGVVSGSPAFPSLVLVYRGGAETGTRVRAL